MTRFLAMATRIGPARSRGEPAETLPGELADEAAELEREQRLEHRPGRRRGDPDDVVDVRPVPADGREDPPLGHGQVRLDRGRARGNEPRPELGREVVEDVLD